MVFGKADPFAASIDLASLNGTNGFRLRGEVAGDYAGYSVSSAGDFNGDGFSDLLIGSVFRQSRAEAIPVLRMWSSARPLHLAQRLIFRRSGEHRIQAHRRGDE